MTEQKIIQGDCLEVMKTFPDKSFDLVLTDPPYNVGYAYDIHKDNLSSDEYFLQQITLLKESERLLADGGSIFYLNYPEFNSVLWASIDFLQKEDIIAWIYHTHNRGEPLRKSFRTWLWFSKGSPRNSFFGEYRNPDDKRVKEYIDADIKPREVDWWLFEQVKNVSEEKTDHPCQVPTEMVKKIILATTKENDKIIDPFLGSGTTLVAAKQLGRNATGIEISEKYCEIARKRLSQEMLF